LPQAVCILFAFAEFYQQLQGEDEYDEHKEPFISPENRVEFEGVISKLRRDVKWNFGLDGEVDIFTKCMVEIKKYIETDIKKTVRKKTVRKKTQSAMSKRKTGVAFSSDNDIKKRFTFNEAQAFFDGKDLGLPSGEAVSILNRLLELFGEVVKHNKLDENSNPSNASDTLKSHIATIRKALKHKRVPFKIESKRGVGYVLQKK
jgi:hypothetical protein